ncbi:hypothetical protein ENSA5_25320 [Enhygromyxa salina]|uniref:Lipoprotein n=1 Tax=Enhygromyxa salina TaxID=215803 RepID=A0A2S9YAQ7_9BACT|nr:DUF885 domain-containing protein [Enhygromyxa salina]PRQ02197.1 hypothetical protein ENSA5_25320 [Enhygromyxa salina]
MHRLAPAVFSCMALLSCGGKQDTAKAGPKPEPADPAAEAAEAAEAAGPTEQPPTKVDTSAWDAFANQALDDYFQAHPAFAVVAGRHEHDGRLPDWSAEGIAKEIARLNDQRAKALAFTDEQLDERARFERDLLVARIDRDLFWIDTAKWPFRNPFFYFDWLLDGLDPAVYVTREYAPLDQRMRAYIAYAKAVPVAARQIRENLSGDLPATYIHFGVAGFGGLASYYENDVPAVFAPAMDAQQKLEFDAANAGAIAAMRELAAFLEAKQPSSDFALGEELFVEMIRMTEGVELSLDELEAAGKADLERNQAMLAVACEQLLPGEGIDPCIAKIAADKPEGGAVAGAGAQLVELRAFLDDKELVTIPGTELARVEEAPPYMRQNSAYIDIPGPYEEGLPSTYYISPPDPAWSAKEQAAYIPGQADLLFTSVHEVWPGHFLQYLHANRSKSELARVFVGYAYSEGWAHYSEEMMCEAGLCDNSPEQQIGQLLNALLRNARFLSAIGLHARGMSVEESKRLFLEQAHQDAGNARQQAARGTYDPAYLNYTMGKLMIRKLRDDWTADRGGFSAWKDFHDAFLAYGGPPVPMVREAMLGADAGPVL